MSDPSKNRYFEEKADSDSDISETDPDAIKEHEVAEQFPSQNDPHLLVQHDLPISYDHPPSGANAEDHSVTGGACASNGINLISPLSFRRSQAVGQYPGAFSHSGDESFLVPIETHFKTSNKPKTYMLPEQEDPIMEKKRKDAIKSFKNRNKTHQKEADLRSTLERTEEEARQFRRQRDERRQRIEEMEKVLSRVSVSSSDGGDATLPEDYHSQQDLHHYPACPEINLAAIGTAESLSWMSPSGVQPHSPDTQSLPTTQGIRSATSEQYEESRYNRQNPIRPFSSGLAMAPHYVGDAQDSFMLPCIPISQETGIANPETHGEMLYNSHTSAILANDTLSISPNPFGTLASNQSHMPSIPDQPYQRGAVHPLVNNDQDEFPEDDQDQYPNDDDQDIYPEYE